MLLAAYMAVFCHPGATLISRQSASISLKNAIAHCNPSPLDGASDDQAVECFPNVGKRLF